MSEQLWQVWYRVIKEKDGRKDGGPVSLAEAQRKVAALNRRDDVIRAWKMKALKKQ